MRPTLQARALKESLLEYLTTTYALSDEGARAALREFLGDEQTGMFRGPFLRVRTPFTGAGPGWEDLLDWSPPGFIPYAHQVAAWSRLSTKAGRDPEPTVVTTGTGSGKTEAFLYPILDHCARERAAGRDGIKSILLYPMNALATDQADRLDKLINGNDQLSRVRAGLYIGDRPTTAYERVATRRGDMRLIPPDILLTNYKMLDLLLQREPDVALWRDADVRFLVVDEFHSYDGAQGSDVAMLLRRLAAIAGQPRPGRPLGDICPVAISATLGAAEEEELEALRTANAVFGVELDQDAVVGENRQSVADFLPTDFDPMLPQPRPEELAALPDPARSAEAFADLVEAVTGERDTDPFRLGAVLKEHMLTPAVLHSFNGSVRTVGEVLNLMWRVRATSWSRAVADQPEVAASALARFLALLSYARDPESTTDNPRPLVHMEVHQWVRSVTRLVRGVLPWPGAEFRWDTPGSGGPALNPASPVTATAGGVAASLFLPAIYCRSCGRSGWAVFSPESNDHAVEFDTVRIRRASTSKDKIRVRNLIAATDAEATEQREPASAGDSRLLVLDGTDARLREPLKADYAEDDTPQLSTADSAFVLANIGRTANTAADDDWCPACEERNAIRYLGTGSAALAAAAITQLFTGGELDEAQREDKTLMFNDSVQDAAHRSGFVATRSFTFSLRALLNRYLSEDRPVALHDLIANVVTETTDPKTLSAVVPTDLHDLRGVTRLLSGRGRGGDRRTWELIGERLAFDAVSEFGFRSRNGRTLELTRTAAANVRIPDPIGAAALVRDAYEEAAAGMTTAGPVSDAHCLGFLRVFLERLRTRGAVHHHWLRGYLQIAGTSRYPIWGGRPSGMRAFPSLVAAPKFLLAAPKERSDFDVAAGRLTWYEKWVGRCFALPREKAPVFWHRLLPALVEAGLLSVGTPNDSTARIYGLQPGAIDVQGLTDDDVDSAFVRCRVCAWEQTVHPLLLDQWRGQPCPAYRCRGVLVAGDQRELLGAYHQDRNFREDYYRRLYREAGTYQVITAEHTGMLSRAKREKTEAAFRGREFNSPNVLSCTPTLELGIDVGELSAVVLAALPRRPANYAQQVGRAGRRTGNAYLLTIPDRSRRDLYFLEQPKEMIAGSIRPPGAHLSAIEILRRQYLAHLLDLAAHGRLTRPDGVVLRPLPLHAPLLFGENGYFVDLIATALAHGENLVEEFLTLFPADPEVFNADAKADLIDFATRGLRGALESAEAEWWRLENMLRGRLKLINQTRDELHDGDPEEAEHKGELAAEAKAIGKRLSDIGRAPAQETLCDLGLLPNYALLDTQTELQATLYWTIERGGSKWYDSQLRSYERPRRYALAELAPGNTFYVDGYKHEITGLELKAGAVRQWRFCPDCGYVRTVDAATDRSPCPRCGGFRLADDGSCLHHVVEPTVVTSRDRREDARISDDRDERERRFYTVIDAVDMPADEIRRDTSWRHKKVTFGVDFCRTTKIRRVNVGQARYDRHAQDDIAGNTVRLSPFHVCTVCGAATADGVPVFKHHVDGISSSASRRPDVRHHRPWCPVRRGSSNGAEPVPQQPVLLAHELQTEALRVLLPAATVLVDERIQSFRAALRLGIDRHYGGDPQHLDTTLAVVPDADTRERRHYLVVFDRLPGGTGYLHRLTKEAAFRDTLADARRVLVNCPCAQEGRRACHRCLHRFTPERFQDIVSRQVALDMLRDLLGEADADGETVNDEWGTDPVRTTHQIGLDRQVESDLESKFLATLRRCVDIDEHASRDEDSRDSGYLRFTDRSDVVRWRLTNQRRYRNTRTDFTFERVDGPHQTVTVYVDGYRFHATSAHNEIAKDADKRADRRAAGDVVFQLTWADLELLDRADTTEKPVWPPYAGNGQNQAREVYEQLGGSRADLTDTVFTNPMNTLLAYLRDPDNTAWAYRSSALVAGLVAGATRIAAGIDRTGAASALQADLASNTPAATTGSGQIYLFRATDTTGLTLRVALDATDGDGPSEIKWIALAVLDDAHAVLDTAEHKLRWRSWLYWSNLVQFLAYVGGDGVVLAGSQVARYAARDLGVSAGPAAPRTPGPDSSSVLPDDSAWREIIDLLDEDEPEEELMALARALAKHGKQAPVFGHELGSGHWQIDFGWPTARVGAREISTVDAGSDAHRRDQAYDAAGWTVRTAADWLADLDTLLTLVPDAEGQAVS